MEKSKHTPTIVSERFTRLFALPIIGIGLIVLIGWFSSLMFLTRFSITEVAMAPSTAYLFITLAVGIWFYTRPKKIAINRNVALASAGIVICLSCLLVITNIIKYYANWEHVFITIPETQLSMPLGHMSLVTAVLFIISGFAFLFLQSNRKIVKTASIILTLIIFIISFILILAYGFATPFFYFGSFIPPAVLTVLSFLLVSLALLVASDRNTFFVKTIWKTSVSAKLLRVFLPTTIAITVIESLILIRILPLFNIHPAVGVSLVSLIVVVVVIVVISILSKSMGKSLDTALNNLSESEEKFRFIFENSPIGKSMTGIDGSLHVNQSFCKIVGYTEDELREKTWMDISHSDEIQQITKSLLNGDISQAKFEKRYIHKNGTIVFTDVSTYLQRDNKGDPQFFITSVSDITERKLVQVELSESEEKLNALFASLTEMVVMHELVLNDAGEAINYRIIDCNRAFTEFSGISKEDAVGKLATDLYQTDVPPYLEEYSKVGLSGEPHEFNTFYAPLEKHLMISVVSPQLGKFATITTDITPMMQIQEMIIAKNKEMENYLYVASHDLRTPLVNIQGFSQRLKKQTDSIKTLTSDKNIEPEILHQLANITDENIPKTLNFIHSNIEKMDTLINGLLQLSRTGKVVMNIQKIDMNTLFTKILKRLDFQIKEAQCEIHIDSLPVCYGDAELLDQLFVNIISNALKYHDVERTLKITVEAKFSYNKVVYTIKDTGKGISQRQLHKIWDVFYRIDPKSDKAGEGLGLSLVKRIAEKHKGKVWAKSEENKGSVFHVELLNSIFTQF